MRDCLPPTVTVNGLVSYWEIQAFNDDWWRFDNDNDLKEGPVPVEQWYT